MVTVYFENSTCSAIVATFEDDALYNLCLPVLEAEAKKQGLIVTESCE